MRGIAGILHLDGRPVSAEQVGGLIDRVALGRVDRKAHWTTGNVGLAHFVAFHQPEDRFEHQPVHLAGGDISLVTDAMLENREELRREFGLDAASASVMPDSAFVARAFERWGEDCARHLEGRFALAAWDRRTGRLYCAVDCFALRPLYFCHLGATFAFASTLRGLLALPGVSKRLHEGVLADYLLYTRTENRDRTLYADISVLPAAHGLRVAPTGVTVRRYWAPDPNRETRLSKGSDYVEAFRSLFEDAVSSSLRVEGDVGILLSGGLDSSAVAALAGAGLARRGKKLQAIHNLSDGADPRRSQWMEHDESSWVRMLQQHAPHIDFHYIRRAQGNFSAMRWEQALDVHCVPLRGFMTDAPVRAPDEPAVRRLLTGLGGNFAISVEWASTSYLANLAVRFRWFRLYREIKAQQSVYRKRPRAIFRHQVLAAFMPARPPSDSRLDMLRFVTPGFAQRTAMAEKIAQTSHQGWRREAFNPRRQHCRTLLDVLPQSVGVAPSAVSPWAEWDTYDPMFNRRLNEFCAGVPMEEQFKDGWDRLLLRRAMRDHLPESLISRRSRGFSLPNSWIATQQLAAAMAADWKQYEHSAGVADILDLPAIRDSLLNPATLQHNAAGVMQLVTVASVTGYLSWLDRKSFDAPSARIDR